MSTQSDEPLFLKCGEVRYGKPVCSKFGPIHENAPYGINSATSDIEDPLQFIPANFFGSSNFSANLIDQEYRLCGALVVKAVKEGLAIMRLRYRAEAGEGEGGRQFLLSHTLLIPGLKYWNDIPTGLFTWCEQSLRAFPVVYDEPRLALQKNIKITRFRSRDITWYDGLSRHRQIQLGSAFQAIRRNVGWAISGIVAEGEKLRPASLISADLDVIASLPSKFPLRVNDCDKFILNLGLNPEVTPAAISYFPGQRGSAIEAPDLNALRVAIISNKTKDSPTMDGPFGVRFFDSLDRRIGSDPIPLRAQSKTN